MERKNPFLPISPGPLPATGARPLEVCLLRGTAIESRYRVHGMIVDASGALIHAWGNPDLAVFPRSAIKPMQAVPWVMDSLEAKVKLDQREMAIACGSHKGEGFHISIVDSWLKRIGLDESNLECGAHQPVELEAAFELVKKGQSPNQMHNNCSGKHVAILHSCLQNSWPVAGYSNFDHPAQERIRKVLGAFFDLEMDCLPWGIDGCGIPTFALPLQRLALGMSRLADPSLLSSQIQEAVAMLNRSIAAEPKFLGGSNSFCSAVVAESEGRMFAKLGAEGVYGAWIPAAGIGIAMKCESGEGKATEVALAAALRELGHELSFFSPLVKRWSGEVVGQFFCA